MQGEKTLIMEFLKMVVVAAMTAARRAATEQASNRSADAEETIKANTTTGMSIDVSHELKMLHILTMVFK